MEEILKGHKDLILGFNKFLSRGKEISSLPPSEELNEQSPDGDCSPTREDALRFMYEVKV